MSEGAPGAESELEYRRFSRLTPVKKLVGLWVVLALAAWSMLQEFLSASDPLERRMFAHAWNMVVRYALMGLGALVVVVAIAAVFTWVYWRVEGYALTGEGIHKRTGLIVKKREHLPWARIHTVEVERTLLDRLFGQGMLKADTGADSSEAMTLGLFPVAECERLRALLLHASAAARRGDTASVQAALAAAHAGTAPVPGTHVSEAESPAALAQSAGEYAGEYAGGGIGAPSHTMARQGPSFGGERSVEVFRLTPSLYLASRALSLGWIGTLLAVVGTIVGFFLTGQGGIFAAFFAIFGVLQGMASQFTKDWGTRVSLTPTGVRTQSGLTTTSVRTIAPGRVHKLTLEAGALWRLAGLWNLSLHVPGNDDAAGESRIIPAGTRADVERLCWVFAENLGVREPWKLIPQFLDARKLWNPEALEHTEGVWAARTPRRMRYLHPFTWKWDAVALTPTVIMVRRHTIFRTKCEILFHEHWQSVAVQQGPLARKLGTASVTFGLAQGALPTPHVESGAARQLMNDARYWAQVRRREDADAATKLATWHARVGLHA